LTHRLDHFRDDAFHFLKIDQSSKKN
jgi:hypothetical protein